MSKIKDFFQDKWTLEDKFLIACAIGAIVTGVGFLMVCISLIKMF